MGDLPPVNSRPTRRQFVLAGASTAVVGVLAGAGVQKFTEAEPEHPQPPAEPGPLQAGDHQPGVDRPSTPQAHLLLTALSWPQRAIPAGPRIETLLSELGSAAIQLTTDPPDRVLPDGPGDLTIQIGLGPRIVRLSTSDLPGAEQLPEFAGSKQVDSILRSGDIVLLVAASDPSILRPATETMIGLVEGAAVAWQQQGLRPPGTGARTRNPFGYHDGVVVPVDASGMNSGVWIDDGAARGGTIGVVRRFELDLSRFESLSPEQRDQVFGRRHVDGAPLSGGTINDEVDLSVKSPEGEYLIPSRSHVRAAHPSFTASPLMMRRSYGFTGLGAPGSEVTAGLLFISYQNVLDTFVRTQRRMDEFDDLMSYVTCTAECTFLVLPGFSRESPLGSTLVGTW